MPMHGLAAWFQ